MDQEGFMLAYHVWMDEGTKMIRTQVTALLSALESHSLRDGSSTYLDSSTPNANSHVH